MTTMLSVRGRVLVADDEASVRRFVTVVLQAAGFLVDVVPSAPEALSALQRAPYDVLIADIKMPGNEHLELVDANSGPSVPLVLMTAEPSVETAVAAFRGGVLDYLVKPFTSEQLLVRVEAALEKGKQSRAAQEAQASVAALLDAAAHVADSLSRKGLVSAPIAAPVHSRQHQSQPGLSEAVIACLSPRQRDIVRLLAQGHPLPEVARVLALSPHTVRGHMKTIFAKLGVQSQVALLSLVSGRSPRNATD